MSARLARSCFCLLSVCAVAALKHSLQIRSDDRNLFKIESFGFIAGGHVDISLRDFSLSSGDGKLPNGKARMGFLLRRAESESAAQEDIDVAIDRSECLLDKKNPVDLLLELAEDVSLYTDVKMGSTVAPLSLSQDIETGNAGLYSLLFVRCLPAAGVSVSFNLHISFYNPGPSYLSAGDAPLPTLYFAFFVVFSLCLALWMHTLVLALRSGSAAVHRIHWMMALLLLLKTLSLLFESMRLRHVSLVGTSEDVWSYLYFITTSLKGVLLFLVLLLIGSGWSLMKPYINDREKKIIAIVLILQVIDNVLLVVLEESAPGSLTWLSLSDLLHLVDIICCCAILFPIVWSIKHLREASDTDGKTQLNISRLQRFRQFYILVVCYIYFTRIIVYLLSATIPFYLLWLSPMFTELATLIFFSLTGYKFRPVDNNPYLQLSLSEKEDQQEFAGSNNDDRQIEMIES